MQKNRIASVIVKDDWKVVEEFDFPRLVKLKLPDIKAPTDLYVTFIKIDKQNFSIDHIDLFLMQLQSKLLVFTDTFVIPISFCLECYTFNSHVIAL